MGLLDVLNSEQGRLGLGLLAAAGGRSDGAGFGQRMAEGLGSYDQWKKQQAAAKFQQMQADEMQAQLEARKAKAAEDERIKKLIAGLGVVRPGMGAGLPAGTLPGAFDIGAQVPALEQSGKIDFAALRRQNVPFSILKELADSENLGKPKVARTTEIEGPNGQKIVQGFDDYGQRVGQGETGYVAPVIVNQGGSTGFQKPVAGASFPITMSPSEKDASARGWASNALAKERLDFDKTKPGAPGAQAKPMPATALRMQNEALDMIGVSSSINADLDKLEKQIDTGKLSFGPVKNVANNLRNMAGVSSDESRNFATFKATLEKLRNDSLRLNKGVQTDGDAQRAWNELFNNINDTKVVKQRLSEIKAINSRAVDLRKLDVENIRSNYNQPSYDYSGQTNVPAAVGAGSERTVVRTGVMGGKKVVQYSDGTTEYAN